MAQLLRGFTALPEDPGSSTVPITAPKSCNFSFKGFNLLFWPPLGLDMHTMHRHMCRQKISVHFKRREGN